jgi:hypothetical protein
MSAELFEQGMAVEVTAVVHRVQPCPGHSFYAQLDGVPEGMNPNGFDPDCKDCRAMEPVVETIDFKE